MDHTASSVPAFINKLWMLVEDQNTNDYIEWSEMGTSFCVLDQSGFAKTVLPLYFKHNNMASFVRQLNMYGFRKVSYPEQGGMKYEGDAIEFHHSYFQRGKMKLLDQIKRKGTSKEEIKIKTNDVNKVLTDVQELKGKQEDMDSRLMSMKRENEGLWQEVMTLRQKHRKQQQVVHRLIQFLMSIIPQRPVKRKRPLMIQDSSINPKIRKQIPSFESASSSNSPALQSTAPVASQNLTLSEILGPLVDTSPLNLSAADPLPSTDDFILAVEGPAATLTEVTEPIVQSPSEIQVLDSLIPENTLNSDIVSEMMPSAPVEFLQDTLVQTSTSNGGKQMLRPGVTLALQRPLSVDEHKQELSDHVENVQSNIELIHELLTNGDYSLDPDTLLPVFYPEPAFTLDQDFLSKLVTMPDEEQPASVTGNELVQYQPSPIQFFSPEDEDSLLSSLMTSGEASASDDGSTKDNELALT